MRKNDAEKMALNLKNYLENQLNEDVLCQYKFRFKIGNSFGTLKNL